MTSQDARRRSLSALVEGCRAEARGFRTGTACEVGSCFELFRRAVCERDDTAWEAAIGRFRGLVLYWVRQHPASAGLVENDDYWVTLAFERFWMAVGPERFSHFPDFAAIARYLKMCVHSVLLDEVRTRRATAGEPLPDRDEAVPSYADADAQSVARLDAADLWRAVARALPDEASRQAIYLSFVHDLKPHEVQRRCPHLYATVADVYRIKRRALDRLRRDVELRAELAGAAAG